MAAEGRICLRSFYSVGRLIFISFQAIFAIIFNSLLKQGRPPCSPFDGPPNNEDCNRLT
jgi:hypothetical protein